MHQSHNNHDSRMMWMMMAACIVPILLVSVAGRWFPGSAWILVIVGIGIVAAGHAILMRNKEHSRDTQATPNDAKGSNPENTESHAHLDE